MDPLSISASAAGLLSLAVTVTQSLVSYYETQKNRDSDLQHTLHQLVRISIVLRELDEAIANRTFQRSESSTVESIQNAIEDCQDAIEELKDECEKITGSSDDTVKSHLKQAGRRIMYPFRQSTLQKIGEDIAQIQGSLTLAISLLHLNDGTKTQTQVGEVKELVEAIRQSQISREIRDWLQVPDATVDHVNASQKRHADTGTWLLESEHFRSWHSAGRSFLWITGFAGTGKSVICSTVIEYILHQCTPNTGVAFFYFCFSDASKQNVMAMLSAFIFQLATQLPNGQSLLSNMKNEQGEKYMSITAAVACLRTVIRKFDDVYLLVDALDECPEGSSRDKLMEVLAQLNDLNSHRLHIFASSRDLPSIREHLASYTTEIKMTTRSVDEDIAKFVSWKLSNDARFRKWRSSHAMISETLSKRANGVFRWVECQFDEIARCPHSESALKRKLESLPRGLDEAYERMLRSIDPDFVEQAHRIFSVLYATEAPISVSELIEVIALRDGVVDPDEMFADENDILAICPGLLNVDYSALHKGYESDDDYDSETTKPPADYKVLSGKTVDEERRKIEADLQNVESRTLEWIVEAQRNHRTVRIAHFSVQEFLSSSRILGGSGRIFHVEYHQAHYELARLCLQYVLDPAGGDEEALQKRHWYVYAARRWHVHLRKSRRDLDQNLQALTKQLLNDSAPWYHKWALANEPYQKADKTLVVPSALYYASKYGIAIVVQAILERYELHQKSRADFESLVNDRHGLEFSPPLMAAILGGHEQVVRLLLANGADIDVKEDADSGETRGSRYMTQTPLQMAAAGESEKIVEMLLDSGADVNHYRSGFRFGPALMEASAKGNHGIVEKLIAARADVNAISKGPEHGTALIAASAEGHQRIVQLLLDNGADANITVTNNKYATAIQAAAGNGHAHVCRILIDSARADVNARGGDYGTAIYAASGRGHKNVVKFLLDHGAVPPFGKRKQ